VVGKVVGGAPTAITAVGARVIDATPGGLKDWAVRTLGANDKPVLLLGIYTILALIACLIGISAWYSRPLALALTVLLGLVGLAAAYADPTEVVGTWGRITPALSALIVSTGLLAWFTRGWDRAVASGRPPSPTLTASADRSAAPAGATAGAPTGFDRRAFLAAAVASGAVVTTGLVASQVGASPAAKSRAALRLPRPISPAPAPSASKVLHVDGITPYITDSANFYRVDTALSVPQLAPSDWSLRIHGLVDNELTLRFQDLLDMPLVERVVTLTCVSNEVGGDLAGNARWLGVRVSDLLERVGVSPSADAVKSTSVDGFTVGTPLAALTDGRDAMIAIGMNGKPLPIDHGFPARMVVSGLYGYVSATKWIVDMEVTRFADFTAYWSDRGWAEQAPIKTASRIDVPAPYAQVKAGKVAVAGVAWAQDTGIAAVQVRVDGGRWQHARLAQEDSIDAWRQWVYEWDAVAGAHELQVRATDKSGFTQSSRREAPRPNGATGWHTTNVTVT
jgi:DMSO/TMAO reductase YedYZ molybdopterin-dependent catalytic subunit